MPLLSSTLTGTDPATGIATAGGEKGKEGGRKPETNPPIDRRNIWKQYFFRAMFLQKSYSSVPVSSDFFLFLSLTSRASCKFRSESFAVGRRRRWRRRRKGARGEGKGGGGGNAAKCAEATTTPVFTGCCRRFSPLLSYFHCPFLLPSFLGRGTGPRRRRRQEFFLLSSFVRPSTTTTEPSPPPPLTVRPSSTFAPARERRRIWCCLRLRPPPLYLPLPPPSTSAKTPPPPPPPPLAQSPELRKASVRKRLPPLGRCSF